MQHVESAASSRGQYLSFTIGGEEYGVDILRVQEIRGWEKVRQLPDTPEYVKGVLELHGNIVPIIDLRTRFNLADVAYDAATVIIVLSVEVDSRTLAFGVVVDGVSDVLDISSSQILDAPNLGTRINTRYLAGMVTLNKRIVILLNVDKLLNPEGLELL
ncbi:MAG: chemotaxis protein CheW [Gammaproteobacteria bacterium]|nr:chemotaxis protein CheW [Gammaproteobacteria bacterium]